MAGNATPIVNAQTPRGGAEVVVVQTTATPQNEHSEDNSYATIVLPIIFTAIFFIIVTPLVIAFIRRHYRLRVKRRNNNLTRRGNEQQRMDAVAVKPKKAPRNLSGEVSKPKTHAENQQRSPRTPNFTPMHLTNPANIKARVSPGHILDVPTTNSTAKAKPQNGHILNYSPAINANHQQQPMCPNTVSAQVETSPLHLSSEQIKKVSQHAATCYLCDMSTCEDCLRHHLQHASHDLSKSKSKPAHAPSIEICSYSGSYDSQVEERDAASSPNIRRSLKRERKQSVTKKNPVLPFLFMSTKRLKKCANEKKLTRTPTGGGFPEQIESERYVPYEEKRSRPVYRREDTPSVFVSDYDDVNIDESFDELSSVTTTEGYSYESDITVTRSVPPRRLGQPHEQLKRKQHELAEQYEHIRRIERRQEAERVANATQLTRYRGRGRQNNGYLVDERTRGVRQEPLYNIERTQV